MGPVFPCDSSTISSLRRPSMFMTFQCALMQAQAGRSFDESRCDRQSDPSQQQQPSKCAPSSKGALSGPGTHDEISSLLLLCHTNMLSWQGRMQGISHANQPFPNPVWNLGLSLGPALNDTHGLDITCQVGEKLIWNVTLIGGFFQHLHTCTLVWSVFCLG